MEWIVLESRDDQRSTVVVPEDILLWIAAQPLSAGLPGLDPYIDAKLDSSDLHRWKDVLQRLSQQWMTEARRAIEQHERLPKDRMVRERVIGTLLERETSRSDRARVVEDIRALIEFALQIGAEIQCVAD